MVYVRKPRPENDKKRAEMAKPKPSDEGYEVLTIDEFIERIRADKENGVHLG